MSPYFSFQMLDSLSKRIMNAFTLRQCRQAFAEWVSYLYQNVLIYL